MDSPALAELQRRVARPPGAGVAASLSLEAVLGRLAWSMERAAADEQEIQRAIQPVVLPAVRLAVTAGVLGTDPAMGLLGPEDGQAWDVRRLTVAGLTVAGGTPQFAEGTVTSPGSAVTIASIPIASLIPGTYTINWSVELAGTLAAVDSNNFRLQGAGLPGGIISDNPAVAGVYPQPPFEWTFSTPFLTPLTIKSIAAGTVGAIYSASMSLTPVASDEVSLYREIGGAGGGNPENLLWTFTPPGTSPGPTWNPGGGLIMRSPESLLLAGTSLAAAAVVISGEAVAVETPWLSRYLL